MKQTKDNFSRQSEGYSKFRPVYPNELCREILEHVNSFDLCWDCATGNGQIASVMASHFKKVVATDISDSQLEKAPKLSNVQYLKCRAEQTPFADNSFDLITVGQAVHWFDHEHFNQEVKRVAKPDSVIAIIGYGLMFSDDAFNEKLMEFYDGTIGAYWDSERKHIDSHYQSIPFPFEEIPLSKSYSIDVKWNIQLLQGYLNTWSSVNRFIKQNGTDPVESFITQLLTSNVWAEGELKDIRFPLFINLGRIRK